MKKILLLTFISLFTNILFSQVNNFHLIYSGFDGKVSSFTEDKSGNMWAAIWSISDQDSINEVILINDQIIDTIFVHSAYPIWDLEVDINNVLWIATQDNGLAKFTGSELSYIDVSEIITLRDRNNVNCIEFDDENNMWIGAQNGIAKFDGNNWTVYDETNSPLQSIPDIYSMSFDNNNMLWFGHYYGVGKLSGTVWSFLSGSPFDYTTTIKHDNNGFCWIAVENGFPAKITSDTTWIQYSFLTNPSWNNQLTGDTNSVMWFGKLDPLEKVVAFDGINFNGLDIPFPEIQNSTISAVFSDKNNNKWFGFDNGYAVKYSGDFPTVIKDDNLIQPEELLLSQNYPNPFNPSTKISWQSPVGGWQTLKVYDVLGNEVATLINEFRNAGSYEVDFNSSALSSGVYLYRLQAGSFVQTRKMILIK